MNNILDQLAADYPSVMASNYPTQQAVQNQAGVGFAPLTYTQQVAFKKRTLLRRVKVLEYIEAQMNMKLFGEDVEANREFERTMYNAVCNMLGDKIE